MAYTAIDDPEAYFQVKTYTGDGGTPSITLDGDTDMQPDFVWIKNRDAADSHQLFDAIRGATKVLITNGYVAESTDADTLTSFDSDGFSLGADVKVNTDTEKYVAWCWKANGAGSANTAGSINTVATSANTTSGFSMVSYVGTQANATIGHGLGVAPKFIFLKGLDQGEDWTGFHIGKGNTFNVVINNTLTGYSGSDYWQDTDPSATLITIGASTRPNNSGTTFAAYCFADVQGFSKFGTYEGNGDADGTFVYVGFRPAYVMCKSIDSTSSWLIFDNKREGYNVDNDPLVSEATTVEATTDMIDLLSNGFKLRIATDPNVAETYIYAAFAEQPFVNSNGVPCNAR